MTKECVIKDLFGILVIVSVNVINHVIQEQYLDYKNCKCRNKLVVKLAEECIENNDGNKMLYNKTLNVMPLEISLNDYKKVCNSCTIYIVLFAVFYITSICISSVFIYFQWYVKKDNVHIKFNPVLKQQSVKNINGKY